MWSVAEEGIFGLRGAALARESAERSFLMVEVQNEKGKTSRDHQCFVSEPAIVNIVITVLPPISRG